MDQTSDEKRADKDLVTRSWLVKSREENSEGDKRNDYSQPDKVPSLTLVRIPSFISIKNNTKKTNLQDGKQKFNKAINSYTTARKVLPLAIPSELKQNTFSLNDDNENKFSSQKVIYFRYRRSMKPNFKVLVSLRNRSLGTNTTMTITEEEEQILDLVKSAGLTLEGIRKVADDIKDKNKKNISANWEEGNTDYNNMEREYFKKIRKALLQSKNVHKNKLFPILYYLSLDSHDCEKSLLCLSETNEDVTQLPVGSRGCIFKALKDTMEPDTLRKVQKLLRDHILSISKVYDQPATEQQKFKANKSQTDAHLEGCSMEKKSKCSQTLETPGRIKVINNTVLKRVKSNTATATITRPGRPNLPKLNPMNDSINNIDKRLGQSNSVDQINSATATITRPGRPHLPKLNPMNCSINNIDKRLGQSMAVNHMDAQKVLPPPEYIQHYEALPRFWVQPPEMYPAQSTGMSQSVDHRWATNTHQVLPYPNVQGNTSQY